MILHRQDKARAQEEIELGGRNVPGLFRPQRIGLANKPPVLVEKRDRGADGFVGDRLSRDLGEPLANLVQLAPVKLAADFVIEILRQVEITRSLLRKHQFPHSRQIANDVADRREEHAVDKIEAARDAQFDGRARNAADIGLVIGVAVNDFELIAAAENPERQRARGVNDLARHIVGHVADHLAPRLRRLPGPGRLESQIVEKILATLDDCGGRGFWHIEHVRDPSNERGVFR